MAEQKQITNKERTIGELLKSKEKQIAAALPEHMTPRKLMRVALTEIQRNPDLKECTETSLITSIIQSCQLGLFPDSLTGEAYLIPRTIKGVKTCTFQPGYQGYLKLAYNSPKIAIINIKEVREKDQFEFIEGTDTKIIHKRSFGDRGEIYFYYCNVKLTNGESYADGMTPIEIDAHKKKYSPGWDKPYSSWQTSNEAMSKKTVLKKTLKYLPKSPENTNLAQALAHDERAEIGIQDTSFIINGDVVDKKLTTSTKSEKIATKLYDKYNKKESSSEKPMPKEDPEVTKFKKELGPVNMEEDDATN